MIVKMVLTPSGPVEQAASRGELARGGPWRPRHLKGPKPAKVGEVDALVFVRASRFPNGVERPSLMAVLHDPVWEPEGWRAEGNEALARDISTAWSKLELPDGGPKPSSIRVRAILKEPRLLSAADLRLLKIRKPGGERALALPCVARSAPTSIDGLSAIEQRQLVQAGRGYDGRSLGAAERLSADWHDGSFYGSLLIRRFAAASGKPAYDVFTYRGDSGCVFRAGTTRTVAHIIQGHLQCASTRLVDLLDATMTADRRATAPVKKARSKKAPPKRKRAATKR